MRITSVTIVALAVLGGGLVAQEPRPVPKDSIRVSISGCTKGYVFTAGPRTTDQPGTASLPEGTHLRMNGPKKLMDALKTHAGSMVEITGIMKKGDLNPDGVRIGGVRIAPGRSGGSSTSGTPIDGQVSIDVEGWRPAVGTCRSR